MTEQPFFFPSAGRQLFAIRHDPDPGTVGRIPFVFCHPMAEEKLWAHRTFVLFARRLAALGHPVLRFDLMGNGDSEGDFSESSIESNLADMEAAIACVRQQTGAEQISLLGLRLGATLAALTAEKAVDLAELVLWAPIANGDRYAQEILRSNVASQLAAYKAVRAERSALVEMMRQGETVNVDGYELAWPLFDGLSRIRLADAPKRFGGACLIVQIDRQPQTAPDLQQLAATYPAATVGFAQEEPFWKEIARSYQRQADNLFAFTLTWLGDRYGHAKVEGAAAP